MTQKALFLCPSPFQIGTYHRALAFARHLTRHLGFEVDLVCTGDADAEHLIQGVRVIETAEFGPSLLPLPSWNPVEIFKRLRFLRRRRSPYAFVYSFEYHPNVWPLAQYVAWRDKSIHFNDWCDWYAGRHHKMRGIKWMQAVDAKMEEYPRSRVDCLTVICNSLGERALSSGVSPEKLLLVREGAEAHGPVISRAEARRRLGIDENSYLVFGMAESKHSLAQSAIHLLAKTRPDARLVIVGKVYDIQEDAKTSLPGRVSDEDLHLWLCAADCAWLALENILVNQGRLPHKIGHFRMYGIPTVTTATSEAPTLGDPGILVADYTAEAFATTTTQLEALTDENRSASRAQANSVFDWDRVLAPWLERVRIELQRRSSN